MRKWIKRTGVKRLAVCPKCKRKNVNLYPRTACSVGGASSAEVRTHELSEQRSHYPYP